METDKNDTILWLDCIGGLLAGVLILFFCRMISDWDNLPLWIVLAFGFANLIYGGYSLWVTTQNPRSMVWIKILALANITWLGICVTIVTVYWNDISIFGTLHKLTEGIYVGSLGYVEWRWREKLAH